MLPGLLRIAAWSPSFLTAALPSFSSLSTASCTITVFTFGLGVTAQAWLWIQTTKPLLCHGCFISVSLRLRLKNLRAVLRRAVTKVDAPAMKERQLCKALVNKEERPIKTWQPYHITS